MTPHEKRALGFRVLIALALLGCGLAYVIHLKGDDLVADAPCALKEIQDDGRVSVSGYVRNHRFRRAESAAGYLTGVGRLTGPQADVLRRFVRERGVAEYLSAAVLDDGSVSIVYYDFTLSGFRDLESEFAKVLRP